MNSNKKTINGIFVTIAIHGSFKPHNIYKDQDHQTINQLNPSCVI
jgi:hypothetical protein